MLLVHLVVNLAHNALRVLFNLFQVSVLPVPLPTDAKHVMEVLFVQLSKLDMLAFVILLTLAHVQMVIINPGLLARLVQLVARNVLALIHALSTNTKQAILVHALVEHVLALQVITLMEHARHVLMAVLHAVLVLPAQLKNLVIQAFVILRIPAHVQMVTFNLTLLAHLVPTMRLVLHARAPQLAQHAQVRFTLMEILALIALPVALHVLAQIHVQTAHQVMGWF